MSRHRSHRLARLFEVRTVSHMGSRLGLTALCTLGIGLTATACSGEGKALAPASATVIPVELVAARAAGSSTPVVATGRYVARDEVPLAFKTGGVVTRVLVDAGDVVRPGQLLATLDLREIDAMVSAAQAGVEKAQRDHDRLQRLVADSVATRTQLQDAATGLEAARAALAQAQVNREYSVITAPEGGLIQQRLVAAGALVAPGQPVLQLGGARRGTVLRAGLADRDAVRIRLGDSAVVRFAALGGEALTGRVTLVARAADPQTGTYAVEVALAAASGIPLGLVGELRLTPRPTARGSARGVVLPMTAILEPTGDSATVLVMRTPRDSLPASQRIRLLGTVGEEALVDGVPAGTLVIGRGAAYVTPGTVVRVIPELTTPPTGGNATPGRAGGREPKP